MIPAELPRVVDTVLRPDEPEGLAHATESSRNARTVELECTLVYAGNS